MSSRWRGLSLGWTLFVWPALVFGHRLDEYLQATVVTIDRQTIRLEISLLPGVAVAGSVLAVIDRDGDGVISAEEATAYGEAVKRDLVVRLDQSLLELKANVAPFPSLTELRGGAGFIEIDYEVGMPLLKAGTHTLSIENRHLPAKSVYLVNAAKPESGAIKIIAQKRNENQSAGEIEFLVK